MITIIGSGNTAAALVLVLAQRAVGEIRLVARNRAHSEAVVRDAASAYPSLLNRIEVLSEIPKGTNGVVIVTAGVQIPAGMTAKDVRDQNVEIAASYVRGRISSDANVVLLGSPVDDITSDLVNLLSLDPARVIGFGGDLDAKRLECALLDIGENAAPAYIIGEHGSRAIPVYVGENRYIEICDSVRFLVKRITATAGPPRNLATGVLAADLAESLLSSVPRLHHVTARVPKYDLHLTWPCAISASGIGPQLDLTLGNQATEALTLLVKAKHAERMPS